MGSIDLIVLGFLTRYAFPALFTCVVFLLLIKNRNNIKKKLMSTALANFDASFERLAKEHKEKLFASLHETKSACLKLKNKGVIRILEVGVRTGENIKYYPKDSHFIGVDCNVHLKRYFETNPGKISNVKVKSLIISERDDLSLIADASVDAVIATLVLCNANNVDHLLTEIWRVLVPGGVYYFLEHTIAEKGTSLRLFQNILSVSRIWPTMFNKCHLNRNIQNAICNAKFRKCRISYCDMKSTHFLFKYMKPHLMGTAIK